MTALYNPLFAPELNWNFSSYNEYVEAEAQEIVINGEEKLFPCIELKEQDSIDLAKMHGWELVPEQPEVETKEKKKTKGKKGKKKK